MSLWSKMKSIVILVFLGSSCAFNSRARDRRRTTPFNTTTEATEAETAASTLSPLEVKSCSGPFSCQDCETVRVCRPNDKGDWSLVRTITCDAFCDFKTGTCTSVPNASCGENDDFICMRESGLFPSASNASEYHSCANYVAQKFACIQKGHAYNPTSRSCEKGFASSSFNCTNKKGLKVPHPTDAQYYAFCGEDTVTVIDSCPDNFKLNATSQICEPHCSTEVIYAYPFDCNKYVKCTPVWIREEFFIPIVMYCPVNTGFDPTQHICVSLNDLPSCKAPNAVETR